MCVCVWGGHMYEVPSIIFQTFLVQAFKIVVSAIGIHPTKS